jgi:hypothetical protein
MGSFTNISSCFRNDPNTLYTINEVEFQDVDLKVDMDGHTSTVQITRGHFRPVIDITSELGIDEDIAFPTDQALKSVARRYAGLYRSGLYGNLTSH